MRLGFVIDQDRCIGCHACTVACKEEHNVPVGVFRTWVKYVEKGTFPATSRHFGVMRCNHCEAAPCVEICPTSALFHRDNGIVDFDSDRCIGCKSCMQACPYDALYIDPLSNTAAKCNFCAHRVELNLEPACVIVCPTRAIMAGDFDDPMSSVSRVTATGKVVSRKPEKGTQPKLYYVGIEGDLLQPGAPAPQSSLLWADRHDDAPAHAAAGAGETREVYNVPHPAPWGWKIATYLWTKSIAAGVLIVAAMMLGAGGGGNGLFAYVAPAIALAAVGVTGLLLIVDLKRPERFYYLLTKSNFKSWVVIGAYILGAYGIAAALWLAAGIISASPPPQWFVWLSAALGVGAACYSGFLFAQAKGRDLWQTPLFTWHLLVQALIAGSASLLIAGAAGGLAPAAIVRLEDVLIGALAVSLVMVTTELYGTHVSHDLELATGLLSRGELSMQFWTIAIGVGIVLPIALIIARRIADAPAAVAIAAAAAALAGLWVYETLWLKAGQAAPLS